MTRPRAALRLAGAAMALLGPNGCATVSPEPPRWASPGESATEAMERLRSRFEAFRTARAVLELSWRDAAGGDLGGCHASLSWVRPDSLRLRGTSAAFFTVFDLVADGRDVRLDVPREGVVVRGALDDPAWSALPVAADDLRIALLAFPCVADGCRGAVQWTDAAGPTLAGAGWTLELERRSGLPARWIAADRGREIRWLDWGLRDGVAWPLRIEIADTGDGEVLEVRMGRVDLDRPIPAGRFSLPGDEAGGPLLTPNQAKERWARRTDVLTSP
jgi:hypothetical protein